MKITMVDGALPFNEVQAGDVFIDLEQDDVAVYIKTDDDTDNAVNLDDGGMASFDRADMCRVVDAELIIR